MQRIKPKYIRIGGIVLAILLVIIIVAGYIAYSKREAVLQKEITSAEAKAKVTRLTLMEVWESHWRHWRDRWQRW